MRPSGWNWMYVLALSVTASVGAVTFEDGPSENHDIPEESLKFQDEKLQQGSLQRNKTRQGKDLFDWIGLGTGQHVDPYLARINQACLNGDLAECFKSRAIGSFADFFDQPEYLFTDQVKFVRMGRDVLQEVARQPYEFSSSPRSDESDWDQLVKFATRKAERFVKTVAIEVNIPSWVTGENEVYAPRFLDEIADEIDTLENKKDTLFSRKRLKKLFIPMLIILKLFKLKLLLFLPLILGLASFKKFLGFMAIVIPGLIGFFKFCKPILSNYQPPVYTQSGLGFSHYKETGNHGYPAEHSNYQENPGYHNSYQNEGASYGQDLAYQGWKHYQE
ncbi:uncharacterized protein LOC107039391 [Diachasma alloeum]|uniref:uncharacterized protein LOC107039391 n=1 Tax=Diachasma alloeum TaxID=454923 RepID=UPI00073831F3|nr:uncharacterized protein LOC107039391 [Diachasma alloeum]